MANIYVTNQKAGFSTRYAFATIAVKFTPNCEVICYKGTKKTKAMSKLGVYVFGVPEAGDWTIEVINKDNQSIASVVRVEERGQTFSISLYFDMILYDAEKQFSIPWDANSYSRISTDQDGALIVMSLNTSNVGNVRSVDTYDLTPYSKLYITYTSTLAASTNNRFGVNASKPGTGTGAVTKYIQHTPSEEKNTLVLDISANENSYIGIVTVAATSTMVRSLKIYKIWAEV